MNMERIARLKRTGSSICISADRQANISLESTLQFSNTLVKAWQRKKKVTSNSYKETKGKNAEKQERYQNYIA